MEKENISLLNYFEKFKEYPEYDKLKQKLDKESKIEYHGDFKIGDVEIPLIGPSKNLEKFSKTIENKWGKEEADEMKYLIKYYDGGEIENDQEALIIVNIKYLETKDELYKKIEEKLISGKEQDHDILTTLAHHTDIMSSSLLFFFLKN